MGGGEVPRDTVEVASLMESSGLPMKIQMTQATADILEQVTNIHPFKQVVHPIMARINLKL